MIQSQLYDKIHMGDLEGVRQWLKQNPDDLNTWIGDRYAPIHVACLFGQEAILQFLLAKGALVNINAMNESRATPLHVAANFRDEEVAERMIQVLIDNGAEMNTPQSGGLTPLHHAVARGSKRLVSTLVLAGADPFLRDEFGRTTVDLAKTLSDLEISHEIQINLKKAFSI